jgi:hypothetical protein
MSRRKYVGVTTLFLSLWASPVLAQTDAGKASPGSTVVVRSGSYQLTGQMLDQVLRYGQILAAADFSPSDAAALRADLIAYFQKEPAKQMTAYETIAKILQLGIPPGKPTWLDLALLRYRVWQSYGGQQRVRKFQSYPFGRMVLKYNPVLVNSGGMIVTKNDVDCLFYSNTMVAKAAGVAPPTEADKDQFVRDLPSQFASMPTKLKEYLRQAEIRLAQFDIVYDGTVKTHAAVLADIRKNVHSSADVWREARQVENDAGPGPTQISAAEQKAVAFASQLAVMQMQFEMKLDAAKAAKDAASAIGNGSLAAVGGLADVSRQSRQLENVAGAAGKYWQSYVKESMAGSSNGFRANNDVISLQGLIKRNSQTGQEFSR